MRASSDGAIPAPYMAYLRIYEPLSAFPAGERTAWQAWLDETASRPGEADASAGIGGGGAGSKRPGLAAEQELSLRGLVAVPPIAVPEHEERVAYSTAVDGVTLICPWQSRLRSWLALTELRAVHGDAAVRLFWPQAVLDQADTEYDQWWPEDPEALPHILTCSWQIPIRWLILFEQHEGRVQTADDDGIEGTLRFRTSMAHARRRSARSLRILKRTIGLGPLVEAVETLSLWLEEFHPSSLVELDYGGLMSLLATQGALGADELRDGVPMDCSVRDVADGLAALAAGDEALMTTAYLRYRVKWDAVRLLGRAN